TAKSPALGGEGGDGENGGGGQRGSMAPVLAGYGVGLPLSRCYARYFGGDLRIESLDGFGTDCFLLLSRLGTDCESLPEMVLQSPAERDSSLPRFASRTQ